MNCCNDFGQCQQGHNCAAHQVTVPVCTSLHCAQLGVCHCTTSIVHTSTLPFLPDDDDMAGRDIVPDYMSPWDWIKDITRIGLAAGVAVGIVSVGLGFIYSRWVL